LAQQLAENKYSQLPVSKGIRALLTALAVRGATAPRGRPKGAGGRSTAGRFRLCEDSLPRRAVGVRAAAGVNAERF
jgi:hypothetical protein